MKVAILGPGAVGGFLAALFWKNKIDVTCISRPESAEILNKNGIKIHSKTFGNFIAKPKIVTELSEPVDLIFITVKAVDLTEALKKINPQSARDSIVIPLLNGLAHIEPLKKRFGKNLAVGTIGVLEVFQDEVGVINHISAGGQIEIGSDDENMKNRLTLIKSLILKTGLDAEILASEAYVVWHKLVRLNALACATAASNKPIGALRSDPIWRQKIQAAVLEAAAVAKREGADINADEVMAQIDKIHPAQLSSLQRDVSRGRPSELEAIAGEILKKCRQYAIDCPSIRFFYQSIKDKERETWQR